MAFHQLYSTVKTHLTITSLLFTTTIFTIFTIYNNSNTKTTTKPHHYHHTYLSLSSNETVSRYHRALTLHPHLAGTPSSHRVTSLVTKHFRKLGFETKLVSYDVLLSYPKSVSLTGVFSRVGRREFVLEDGVDTDLVRPYHAYSPSGAVVGLGVYVNYGREEDYEVLMGLGVEVRGCVVLVRRGGVLSRGDLVRKAAEKGAVAVLTYDEAEGAYVKGVERGTVMKGLGDPLSPGWGSVLGSEGERLGRDDEEVRKRFPRIPSLPVSMEVAEEILGSLEGVEVPLGWRDGSGKVRVERVGPGPTLLNFSYQGEEKMATISDVFAVIQGSEEPDRYVLLGNHRDAWTYGAVDPNSGTAALLDVARRYAYLMGSGWRPRRTIILCSWDAEEFGMVGSTEWVEENIMNIGSKAVAYLNVDCAAQGAGIFPSATPQLDDLLIDITRKIHCFPHDTWFKEGASDKGGSSGFTVEPLYLIKDPDNEAMTVYDEWIARNQGVNIQRLSGVDSDFAPFLQHAGVPSVDIYFGKDFPVYHTAFDSYDWMITHGDPLFHRHAAVAGLWGLLALRLADDPILPFNYSSYAVQLQEYTDTLSRMLKDRVSVVPLTNSIQHLLLAAKHVQNEAKKLREDESLSNLVSLKKRILNDRLMLAERGLLDADGLQGNKWFKHLVYGPSNNHDIELGHFPSIANAMSQKKTIKPDAAIQHEIWRVARAIQRAADALRGDLP